MASSSAALNAPLLVRGGTLVSPELGSLETDLLIRDGRIAAVGSDLAANGVRQVDARGCLVFPGFIDPHMHLGNYRPFDDECVTETAAALAGGTTTVLSFCKVLRHRPEQTSYLDLVDELAAKVARLSHVDVGLHCVIGTEQHIREMPACVSHGLRSFKFYMAYRNDERAVRRGTIGLDDGLLYRGYQGIAAAGPTAVAVTHCENNDICRVLDDDPPMRTYADWAASRPVIAESEAIGRAIHLARAAGAPLYVVHVSSGDGLDVVRTARRDGVRSLWVETTPHYLTLDSESCAQLSNPSLAKVAPPIRDRGHVERLWDGVRDGTVDTVGSDHNAVDPDQKGDLVSAAAGFPSIEVAPALVISGGLQREVPAERLAAVLSTNVARIFGLYPTKGSLKPGADADIAIVDPSDSWTFESGHARSASKLSPYDGLRIGARVRTTILRGQVAYDNGEIVGSPRGRPLFG